MNTPTITFTPNAADASVGTLTIPGTCSLEALYNHPQCPNLVKKALETHISWQMRCETPIHRALNLKNQFMQFRAAMAVYGADDIAEEEEVIINIGKRTTGSSMVRPTPGHTPIVSSFAGVELSEGVVKSCHVAITGIEKRRLSQPEVKTLIGKKLDQATIKAFAQHISELYPGFEDFNGTAKYRKAMVSLTIERALCECVPEVNHG